jgi:serine/threonine-protein kinase
MSSLAVKDIFGFKVIAPLGTGAASMVFAVQDPADKQIYALKHVVKNTDKDQRYLDQVELEYEIGSKLSHPNIRALHKIHRNKKFFKVVEIALTMELLDAPTLDKALPKTMVEAAGIFAQIARGLAHMHDKGFCHADMKPINVMIADGGTVKIIDLGQACALSTVKKRIQGTPGYLAPEQAHRQEVNGQTDIYNLGATMYWVLVGDTIPTAIPSKSDPKALGGEFTPVAVKPPVPPAARNKSIHPMLSDLILECVQVRPGDRPASMQLVAQRLEDLRTLFAAQPDGVRLDTRGWGSSESSQGSWER